MFGINRELFSPGSDISAFHDAFEDRETTNHSLLQYWDAEEERGSGPAAGSRGDTPLQARLKEMMSSPPPLLPIMTTAATRRDPQQKHHDDIWAAVRPLSSSSSSVASDEECFSPTRGFRISVGEEDSAFELPEAKGEDDDGHSSDGDDGNEGRPTRRKGRKNESGKAKWERAALIRVREEDHQSRHRPRRLSAGKLDDNKVCTFLSLIHSTTSHLQKLCIILIYKDVCCYTDINVTFFLLLLLLFSRICMKLSVRPRS